MGVVGFSGQMGVTCPGCASPPWACARPAGWRWIVAIGAALAAAGFGGFFTALAGRVMELYAQAGTDQEPGGTPE